MIDGRDLLDAAHRLYAALERCHLHDGLLRGPDPGVRFNLRAWRFLKSALDFLPWHEAYVFNQTQGYWALSNWMLHELTGERRYRDAAVRCAEAVLARESPQGTWQYPLPERKHLIATLELMWGAVTLLAAQAREPRQEFIEGAVRACNFITDRIGFQPHDAGEAINYFDRPRGKVPNNSVTSVWFFLHMKQATGDARFAAHVPALVRFVESVQAPDGEIPYIVEGPFEPARHHYLCFQYNAFEFLYMAWAERLAPGTWSRSFLERLARFLERGVQPRGSCANDCSAGDEGSETDYYTAALGAALYEAHRLGFTPSDDLSQRSYARLLRHQRPDGSFGYSKGDYGLLSDGRSYPRQQAMTLFHLLAVCGLGDGFQPEYFPNLGRG